MQELTDKNVKETYTIYFFVIDQKKPKHPQLSQLHLVCRINLRVIAMLQIYEYIKS